MFVLLFYWSPLQTFFKKLKGRFNEDKEKATGCPNGTQMGNNSFSHSSTYLFSWKIHLPGFFIHLLFLLILNLLVAGLGIFVRKIDYFFCHPGYLKAG